LVAGSDRAVFRVPTKNKKQSTIGWYYRRLRSMPLAEIPHRVIEIIHRRLGRYAWIVKRDTRLTSTVLSGQLPTLPLNRSRHIPKVSERFVSTLEADVDSLCAGNIRLLGIEWPTDRFMDWSLDPESGLRWDWQRYTFDIPRRSGQGPGDVKFVWELSRLQHLQSLAYAAHLQQRDDAKLRCLEGLEKWLYDNPPYRGLGYGCGIELASRVISILVIVTYLEPESFDQALRGRLWKALNSHGRFIARFPSLYSSANNHLVAESAALFVLGSVAPELGDARVWQEVGWKRLVDEAERQILVDGTGAEQSPTYLAYTLEWLLIARMVKVAITGDSQTGLDTAIRRGATFISSIADINGNVPFIGDCDGGVVLRPGLAVDNYTSSLVAAAASCLHAPEISHPAFVPDLRSHMLTDDVISHGKFEPVSKTFSVGGYSVIRAGTSEREILAILDHGPLGFAETAAHGHADALSVWLHIDGHPILVDFGTYRYNADDGWRAWARSTAAHNTIEIDGVSQSEMTGPFNWGRRAKARLLNEQHEGAAILKKVVHTGYEKLFGVVHERTLSIADSGNIEINDTIQGTGKHDVRVSYNFASDVDIESQDESGLFVISRNSAAVATLRIDCAGLSSTAIRQAGELLPGPGVISTEYNDLRPSFTLVADGSCELPLHIKSIIRLVNS